MGWFDKKSWQLRRKIRDLQSELAVAEREGKYVVAQGLFFAELQDMGDATMMVLGKADTLDTEEEAVIRNFFERNGFSVEHLRLDKTHKTLAAVEIIPPEEFTRKVAKVFKDKGFKLVDDSESEKPSSLEDKRITLSCLIRTISALFASHVHQLIVSTPIKMNMEGNRLLHWMPPIRDSLLSRVPSDLVDQCREPFVDAYNVYYARFGQIENPQNINSEAPVQDDPLSEPATTTADNELPTKSESAPAWQSDPPALSELATTSSNEGDHTNNKKSFASDSALANSPERAIEAGQTLARMYKALIGASDKRKARNAEMLLDYIAQFFHARSACVLGRHNESEAFRLIANSGNHQCTSLTEDGQVTCEVPLLEQSLLNKTMVAGKSNNGSTNPSAVTAPLSLDSPWECALYLVEPSIFFESDSSHIAHFTQVFREFPDLLISLPKQK